MQMTFLENEIRCFMFTEKFVELFYFLFIMSAAFLFLAQKEVLKLDRKESTKVYHLKCTLLRGSERRDFLLNQRSVHSLILRRIEAEEFLVQARSWNLTNQNGRKK